MKNYDMCLTKRTNQGLTPGRGPRGGGSGQTGGAPRPGVLSRADGSDRDRRPRAAAAAWLECGGRRRLPLAVVPRISAGKGPSAATHTKSRLCGFRGTSCDVVT